MKSIWKFLIALGSSILSLTAGIILACYASRVFGASLATLLIILPIGFWGGILTKHFVKDIDLEK